MKQFFTFLLLVLSTTVVAQTFCYEDTDRDGYGDPNSKALWVEPFGCPLIGGPWVSNGLDCNDGDANINPNTVWYKDADNDGYSDGISKTQCTQPTGYKLIKDLLGVSVNIPQQILEIDCDDNDFFAHPGSHWYADPDNDGYINFFGHSVTQCDRLAGYKEEMEVPDEIRRKVDCNQSDPIENPDQKWYKDEDGDKYPADLTYSVNCSRPDGYSAEIELKALTLDCADDDASLNSGMVWYKDSDNDGYSDGSTLIQCEQPTGYKKTVSAGTDCNDNNTFEHPNQVWVLDSDGDRHGRGLLAGGSVLVQCSRPAGYFAVSELTSQGDCNDGNASIFPGAEETCDNVDNNCNGQIDEGVTLNSFVLDADGDGYYTGDIITQCASPGSGYALYFELILGPNKKPGDCDDNNPAVHATFSFYADNDGDHYGAGSLISGICAVDANTPPAGYSTNNTDCDDNAPLVWRLVTFYTDKDHDGYDAGSITACAGFIDAFQLGVAGSSLTTNGSDCDDNNAAVHSTFSFYADNDHDGYGIGNLAAGICATDANTPPTGYSKNNTDCDDNNVNVWQQVIEWNDKDHDGYSTGGTFVCVGVVDPSALYAAGLSLTTNGNDCNDNDPVLHTSFSFYADSDGDLYGAGSLISGICALDANTPPAGYSTNNTDCNDNAPLLWRLVTFYTDKDHDGYDAGSTPGCAGLIDPFSLFSAGLSLTTNGTDCDDNNAAINPATVWYKDADNDNYSNGSTQTQCSRPTGYKLPSELTASNGDCDDNNAALKPTTVWYKDADSDGYSSGATQSQCVRPTGYRLLSELVAISGDCNDNNPAINPAAAEVCRNNIDDNCNGIVDDKAVCEKCTNASNLNTTNITSASVQFNWSAIANPEQWRIQYKSTKPNSKWVTAPLLAGTIRSVTISSLIANQNYSWQIGAKCNGSWTTYSSSVNFKTLANGATGNRLNNSIIKGSKATTLNTSTLSLYPNPNRGQFMLDLRVGDKINATAKIQVIDMTGKTVQIQNAEIYGGRLQKTIKLSSALPKGIYLVRIIVNDKVYKTNLVYEE